MEIAFFVAPRALATVVPRRYNRKVSHGRCSFNTLELGKMLTSRQYQYREGLVFALSTAIVMTTVKADPRRVRGVLGNVLQRVVS